MYTVGPVQENCFLVRVDGATHAVIVDPGEEAPRLLKAIEGQGLTLDAILLTHTHFDHVGAVAPLARATGAPVYCPELEVPVLQDIMAFVPWPGFGPFESWDPEHTVKGGETLELAGMTFDVRFTPGHSPGHVTYAVARRAGPVLRRRPVRGLGRPRRPPRRRLADAPRLDRRARRRVRRRHRRLPRPHGHHDARRRARDQPVPARAVAAVSAKIQAPRGTSDVLPDAADARASLEATARRVLEGAGYRRIETPTFEATDLFARGVGESTDIVQKEMYTFDDGGGRSVTLRPEGTAPICRAYVEHGMHKLPRPGEALVPVELLQSREAAGGPLPPVLADRRRGRSAPTTRPSTRRRSSC